MWRRLCPSFCEIVLSSCLHSFKFPIILLSSLYYQVLITSSHPRCNSSSLYFLVIDTVQFSIPLLFEPDMLSSCSVRAKSRQRSALCRLTASFLDITGQPLYIRWMLQQVLRRLPSSCTCSVSVRRISNTTPSNCTSECVRVHVSFPHTALSSVFAP